MGPESKEQTKFIVSKKETKITVESMKQKQKTSREDQQNQKLAD